MRILAFSDTHGSLFMSKKAYTDMIPEGQFDYILVAGDIFPLQIQRDDSQCLDWWNDKFLPDMYKLLERTGAKEAVIVAGNHDFAFEHYPKDYWQADKVVYLENDAHTLVDSENKTYTVFGSPYLNMSTRSRWAFDTKNEKELENMYKTFPSCDIFLTHCPPYGLPQGQRILGNRLDDFGSKALRNFIDNSWEVTFDNIICGHIHDGRHGVMQYNGMNIINVACKNDEYNLVYPPTVIEINKTDWDLL